MDRYQYCSHRQHEHFLVLFLGGGVWEIQPQSALPTVAVQISWDSAEARMVMVVARVSKVEMHSDVNLHLKRLNAVTHMGGDWSFSGTLALSDSLGNMKVEMEGESRLKVMGAGRRAGSRDSLDESKEIYLATSYKSMFNFSFLA